MKKKIHPKYYDDAVVTCNCGNTFVTGSTQKQIQVEICSACHPFFTGEMKYIDTLGRVEKFQKQQAQAKKYAQTKKTKKKPDDQSDQQPRSLKAMLSKARSQVKLSNSNKTKNSNQPSKSSEKAETNKSK